VGPIGSIIFGVICGGINEATCESIGGVIGFNIPGLLFDIPP